MIILSSTRGSSGITPSLPGHEHDIDRPNDTLYNKILGFETVNVAICRMLQHTPPGFESFRPTMEQLFVENIPNIVKNLAVYKKEEGRSVNCPIWNWVCKFEVGGLLCIRFL